MTDAPKPLQAMVIVGALLLLGSVAMVAVARENQRVNPRLFYALAPVERAHREGDVFVARFPVRESPILSEDGRRLDYTFSGSSPLERGNPCTADYRPILREDDEQVTVTFEELTSAVPDPRWSGNIACPAVAYTRTAGVTLNRPLGHRRLVQQVKGRRMGEVVPLPACPARRPVVSRVAPVFSADPWPCQPISSYSGVRSLFLLRDDPKVAWDGGWSFSFDDANGSDKCNISAGLVFGKVDTLDWGRSKPDGSVEENITLRRGPARLVTADSTRYMYLRWTEKGQRFQLSYWSSCRKFPERRRADLIRMAESVKVPAPS